MKIPPAGEQILKQALHLLTTEDCLQKIGDRGSIALELSLEPNSTEEYYEYQRLVLKFLRVNHKLTQQALGQHLGMGQNGVSYVETKGTNDIKVLIRYANYFGIPLTNLLSEQILIGAALDDNEKNP